MAVKIKINNEDAQVDGTCVQDLVAHLELPERGVAIAVNNRVVPRAAWADTMLNDGDNITVIKAAFGG